MGMDMEPTKRMSMSPYPQAHRAITKPRLLTMAAAVLLATSAHAAEWTLTPSLNVSETYTDNVNLQPTALAKSDWITQVTPGLSVSAKGPNLTLRGTYSLQETYYGNHNAGSSLTNLLNADAKAKFIDNLLYLDSAASITQQNISAFGAQALDNTNKTNNRTTVRTTRVSPYLSRTFGSDATAELRYARDSVTASSGGLSNSHTDTVSFKADSGQAFQTTGWGLQYTDQNTSYTSQSNVRLQNVTTRLSYRLAPRLRLTGSVGYDNNTYSAISNSSSGYSWTTGFDWIVSERTSLTAAIGHKYYGNTFSLAANTRSRIANWTLGYEESVSTTPSQFSLPTSISTATFLNQLLSPSIPDATARAQAVDKLIRDSGLPSTLSSAVNSFSNAVFLQKQLQASVLLNSPKTTLLISLFDIQREPLSTTGLGSLVGNANDKTEQIGGSAVLSRRLSAVTSANATLVATKVKSLTSGRVDNTQSLRLSVSEQLSQKMRGTVEVRHNQGQSNQADVSYRENAVGAYLNLQL